MENNKLAVLGQSDLAKGGIGVGSRLFQIKPATIQLVQKMSRAEGAIPGKLRIKETGQHFDEMYLVMLFEPTERRSYFEGDDYSPDNQICFSLDNIRPHERAKIPQAMSCANCPKASWEKYRQTKNKADIPKCKNSWHNVVIDRVTKLPYNLDVKSTSIAPFTMAMQDMARQVALLQSQGKNPNIFDFSFKLSVEAQNKGTYFTYKFSEVAPIAEADKAAFGEIFLDFAKRGVKTEEDKQAAAAEAEAEYLENDIVENSKAPVAPTVTDDEIPF